MVRLYIGGLPADCTPEQLGQRFAPFGHVLACELAPAKEYRCSDRQEVYHRGFAHVELEPKDDAALKRCIQAYNGSKWRGHVLRCQLAKQSGLQRLEEERAAEAAVIETPAKIESQPMEPGPLVLRLRRPNSHALMSVKVGRPDTGAAGATGDKPSSNTISQALPATTALPISQLSWEPLPQPPNARYVFEAHLHRVAASMPAPTLRTAAARGGAAIPHHYSPEGSHTPAEALHGAAKQAAVPVAAVNAGAAVQQQQQQQLQEQPARKKLRVVDFTEGEQQAAGGPAGFASSAQAHHAGARALDLSRFDSDSEEEQHAVAPAAAFVVPRPQRAQAAPAPIPAVRKQPAAQQRAAPAAAVLQMQGEEQMQSGDSDALSGSSGASELEEFLAEDGADAEVHSGSGEEQGEDEQGVGQQQAMQQNSGSPQASGSSGDVSSSGASELEEFLAEEGAGVIESSDSGGRGSQEESEQDDGVPEAEVQPLPQHLKLQPVAVKRSLPPSGRQAAGGAAAAAEPAAVPAKRQRLVDFLTEEDQGILQRKQQAADLSAFAGSSEEEDEGQGRPGAAAVPVGGRRLSAGGPQLRKPRWQRWQAAQLIPQTDGAADTSSSSDESSSGDESEESEGRQRAVGAESSSSPSSGSSSSSDDDQRGASEDEEESSSGSESEGSGGADAGPNHNASSESDASDSEEPESGSGESASSEPDTDSNGSEGATRRLPAPGSDQADAAAGQQPAESPASSNRESDSDDEGKPSEQQYQPQPRESQEDLAWLAAALPAAAAFYRSEPLAQVEATWRVTHEAQLQQLRQQARQARRMHSRAAGGSKRGRRK